MNVFETADGAQIRVVVRDGEVIVTGHLPGEIVLSRADVEAVLAEPNFKGLWTVAGIAAGDQDAHKYVEALKAALDTGVHPPEQHS